MASKASDLKRVHVYGPYSEFLAGFIREKFRDLEFVTCTDRDELEACIGDIEVLLCQRPPKDSLARADKITWIMTIGAGVDTVLPNPGLREECIITNARGVHNPQIPEFVLGMILALGLRLPEHFRSQMESEWQLRMRRIMASQVVGVIGLGTIGREIARMANAIGMRVIGTKNNPEAVPHVEQVYGADELLSVLSESDFVVLIAALTPETRGVIGKAELAAMKPDSFLINVARGAMVVEADLIEALQNGTIAGAALDVFETEPLPPESPLWKMENVIITPHIAGARPDYLQAVSEIFCKNLARYISGEPLFNVVDRDKCY
jgi:phosphoglycerate dehydrogenase-like enzyme